MRENLYSRLARLAEKPNPRLSRALRFFADRTLTFSRLFSLAPGRFLGPPRPATASLLAFDVLRSSQRRVFSAMRPSRGGSFVGSRGASASLVVRPFLLAALLALVAVVR